MENIRLLNAGEIDCRIGTISKDGKGLSLLLYKDARCDMNILDEVFGSMNWKREHSRDNRNCTVSIWDEGKHEWVSKEDTGTESNTEAEKGLASDSFKRACFNWGIGRELYTAPFIWVTADKCNIQNGKCYDKFVVERIGYNEKREINELAIMNEKTGAIVFEMYECACCFSNLKPYVSEKTGKSVGIREHAELSRKMFNGHVYCYECISTKRIEKCV